MLFAACIMHSVNLTRLFNETGEGIEVKFFYDRRLLDSLRTISYNFYKSRHPDSARVWSYYEFLTGQATEAWSFFVSVDTITTSVTYKIPRNQRTDFFTVSGRHPISVLSA
jgi:hypothetical protein